MATKPNKNSKYSRGNRNKGNCKPKNTNANSEDDNKKPNEPLDASMDRESTNDPNWYAASPQLLKDAASLSFGYATGLPLDLGDLNVPNPNSNTGLKVKWTAPGVMVYYMRPHLPFTDSPAAAVNAVALKQFAIFRATVSSKLPYDPVNLTIMEIAIANVYSFCNFCIRAYSMAATLYQNENRYVPDTLLQVQGIDPNSMLGNLAQFRAWLNLYITRVAALSVPSSMQYFKRTAMLYQYLYTEGTSVKDQLYMYAPEGFWQYNEVTDQGANLQFKPWANLNLALQGSLTDATTQSVDNIIDFGNSLLDALYQSEDIGIMSANILRAYGSNNTLKLQLVPEYPTIVPVFDIAVLEQMQNTTILGDIMLATAGWNPTQAFDSNNPQMYLKFTPKVKIETKVGNLSKEWAYFMCQALSGMNRILSTTTEFTDPGLVIESTRGMTYLESLGNGEYSVHGGTEICVKAVMYQKQLTPTWTYPTIVTGLNAFSLQWCEIHDDSDNEDAQINSELMKESFISSFKFRPHQVLIDGSTTGTYPSAVYSLVGVYPSGQLDNYTVVHQDELRMMNEQATYALFDLTKITPAW